MLQPLYNKGTLEEGIIEALRHIDAFNDIDTAKECLRTALSPNEKWAINLLNSSEGEGMKFKTLNGYPLPFFNNSEVRPEATKGARLCVVYQVWGNHNYLKFLYLSILSQIASSIIIDFLITEIDSSNKDIFKYNNLIDSKGIDRIVKKISK